ncbi:DinB family protein [Rhodococcus sovatensis]|uniref:DinB family protein n=1 Tax=Rhodococcus sovatensis TaxID=1805840 RepID=A0ABZ2PTT4_9NOCA
MTAGFDSERPLTGGERVLLENTLDLHRAELVKAVDGLSDAEARQKLVPSLTTPISLLKHCAVAERIWFQRTLAGIGAEDCNGFAVTGGDASFHVTEDELLVDVIAEFDSACDVSRRIAAKYVLDDTGHHRIFGTVSLRFIYLFMIAELARHAGHADILVEQIEVRSGGRAAQ